MDILTFLDRMGERRANRPARPLRDIRQFIGAAFIFGYYFLVYKITQIELPKANEALFRDALLTLGPPIGAIIGAMFRSDARDEQATVNSGKLIDTMKEQAKAVGKPDMVLEPGDSAQIEAK